MLRPALVQAPRVRVHVLGVGGTRTEVDPSPHPDGVDSALDQTHPGHYGSAARGYGEGFADAVATVRRLAFAHEAGVLTGAGRARVRADALARILVEHPAAIAIIAIRAVAHAIGPASLRWLALVRADARTGACIKRLTSGATGRNTAAADARHGVEKLAFRTGNADVLRGTNLLVESAADHAARASRVVGAQ